MENAFDRARLYAQELSVESPILSEKTLVIIDMQEGFMDKYGDERSIAPAIRSLIKCARRNEWPIIIVEYKGSHETIEEISIALEGYPHQETVIKTDNDGGYKVIKCLEDHPAWSTNLLVCGIYGNACVPSTVAGLFRNSDWVEVDVVIDAIYDIYHSFSNLDEYGGQPESRIVVEDVLSLVGERCEV